jgi:hypothetical protein
MAIKRCTEAFSAPAADSAAGNIYLHLLHQTGPAVPIHITMAKIGGYRFPPDVKITLI